MAPSSRVGYVVIELEEVDGEEELDELSRVVYVVIEPEIKDSLSDLAASVSRVIYVVVEPLT